MLRKLTARRLRLMLLVVSALALLIVRLSISPMDEAMQVTALAESKSPSQPDTTFDVAKLSSRSLPPLHPSLFDQPQTAPVAEAADPPAAPPSEPVPPPLPYAYLGQYRDAEGSRVFYLNRDEQVILAKPGTQLDNEYRLEADVSHGLIITYLPLNKGQTLPIGNLTP